MVRIIKIARDTPADPDRLRNIDITGREREPRYRQRPVRPDAQRIEEIREQARQQFELNPMVALCRSGTRQAEIDRAERRKQGAGGTTPRPIKQRWSAFLIQAGQSRLTATQKRSLCRRSTREELLALAPYLRQYLGAKL